MKKVILIICVCLAIFFQSCVYSSTNESPVTSNVVPDTGADSNETRVPIRKPNGIPERLHSLNAVVFEWLDVVDQLTFDNDGNGYIGVLVRYETLYDPTMYNSDLLIQRKERIEILDGDVKNQYKDLFENAELDVLFLPKEYITNDIEMGNRSLALLEAITNFQVNDNLVDFYGVKNTAGIELLPIFEIKSDDTIFINDYQEKTDLSGNYLMENMNFFAEINKRIHWICHFKNGMTLLELENFFNEADELKSDDYKTVSASSVEMYYNDGWLPGPICG